MRVGVTGPRGRVGSALVNLYGAIPIEGDIVDVVGIEKEIKAAKLDVLINCAAFTDVDGAQGNIEAALPVNTTGVAHLRIVFDGYMIHLSTSYIFDGVDLLRYKEGAQPNPINDYGFSKFGGEAVLMGSEKYLRTAIVRTVSLYTPYGNKPDPIRNILAGVESGVVIRDSRYITSPTYVPHLAEALMVLAEKRTPGVINIAGTTKINMYKLAKRVAKKWYGRKQAREVFDRPYSSLYRPRNSSLSLSKAKRIGLPVYSLKQGLKEMKRDYHGRT